ncbi:mothers against decapentaplegic 6-like X3 [Biomphalaria pfeifferi]|uniref:Mothers against decapentaplegic 6-like X3 n=1 Tax=Biomphalaria pfeifferi TaxID=112525 RepID=A0AAD8EV04_BIOPF|nr:mothers against decapentaplegic 6-like X3 [Biomphalaria pfeifferi]
MWFLATATPSPKTHRCMILIYKSLTDGSTYLLYAHTLPLSHSAPLSVSISIEPTCGFKKSKTRRCSFTESAGRVKNT